MSTSEWVPEDKRVSRPRPPPGHPPTSLGKPCFSLDVLPRKETSKGQEVEREGGGDFSGEKQCSLSLGCYEHRATHLLSVPSPCVCVCAFDVPVFGATSFHVMAAQV